MDVVIKEGIVVGDAVLLSCGDSAGILKVQDVDGCQIRLDGEVKSINGEWCSVLVKCERLGRIDAMVMFKTRLSRVKVVERVHEWTRLNAKTIDRVRRTGTDKCDYWVPLTSDS